MEAFWAFFTRQPILVIRIVNGKKQFRRYNHPRIITIAPPDMDEQDFLKVPVEVLFRIRVPTEKDPILCTFDDVPPFQTTVQDTINLYKLDKALQKSPQITNLREKHGLELHINTVRVDVHIGRYLRKSYTPRDTVRMQLRFAWGTDEREKYAEEVKRNPATKLSMLVVLESKPLKDKVKSDTKAEAETEAPRA